MTQLPMIGLTAEALARMVAVAGAPIETEFAALIRLGGLDPARDLRRQDLRGWPLSGEDVRGFDFTGADLRGTGIEKAVKDKTTVFSDARFDDDVDSAALKAKERRRNTPPPGAYTKVRVPDLTDAELLERSFVISEPMKLENVTSSAPPTEQWLTYEGRYDVGEPVLCAFHHHHKRGYVFRDEDDRRFLVGNRCGGKHLGLGNWTDFIKGREGLEDRASYLRLLRDLGEAFRKTRSWIEALPSAPEVRAFEELRRKLWAVSPEMVKAAKKLVSDDSTLIVVVTERDEVAEKRRENRQNDELEKFRGLSPAERNRFFDQGGREPKIERDPIVRRTPVRLGILQGASLFRSSPTVGHLIRNNVLPFVDLFLSRTTPEVTKRGLLDDTRSAKDLVNRLEAIQQSVAEASLFFEAENLARVARWADHNGFDACKFSVAFSGGMRVLKNGRSDMIERPDDLRPLAPEPLDILRVAAGRASESVARLRAK